MLISHPSGTFVGFMQLDPKVKGVSSLHAHFNDLNRIPMLIDGWFPMFFLKELKFEGVKEGDVEKLVKKIKSMEVDDLKKEFNNDPRFNYVKLQSHISGAHINEICRMVKSYLVDREYIHQGAMAEVTDLLNIVYSRMEQRLSISGTRDKSPTVLNFDSKKRGLHFSSWKNLIIAEAPIKHLATFSVQVIINFNTFQAAMAYKKEDGIA